MRRCFGPDRRHKMHKLLEYSGQSRDVADPWFTGNFDETYADISAGCKGLFESLAGNLSFLYNSRTFTN